MGHGLHMNYLLMFAVIGLTSDLISCLTMIIAGLSQKTGDTPKLQSNSLFNEKPLSWRIVYFQIGPYGWVDWVAICLLLVAGDPR